jgi:hypothetical protein
MGDDQCERSFDVFKFLHCDPPARKHACIRLSIPKEIARPRLQQVKNSRSTLVGMFSKLAQNLGPHGISRQGAVLLLLVVMTIVITIASIIAIASCCSCHYCVDCQMPAARLVEMQQKRQSSSRFGILWFLPKKAQFLQDGTNSFTLFLLLLLVVHVRFRT